MDVVIATVHQEVLAGDVRRFDGSEEQDSVSHVLRDSQAS